MTLTSIADPYVPYSMPFSQYQEQLEWIFKHNDFPEERYKTSFLAVCGKEVFIELKRLFPGKDFNELTYKQITDELKKRYDKNDSAVVHSYKFWTKRQGRNESLEDFVITVKNLAERCDFGEFKDRAIRDMLVIGLSDVQLQKRLCDEEDLSATKAERLILNSEISASRTRQLKHDDDRRVSVVARLGNRPEVSRSRNRFRNRSRSFDRNRSFSSRSRSNSKYRGKRGGSSAKPVYICSFCKKTGHTRKFCYSLHDKSPRRNQSSVKFVDTPKPSTSSKDSGLFKRLKKDLDNDSDYSDGMPCLMISSSSVNKINEPCYVEVLVSQKRLTMEIDCGSAESVISEELYLRNFANCKLQSCNKKLVVIDGNKLKVVGRIYVDVQLAGRRKQLSMVVLRCNNDFIPLVGRTWLDEFYFGWRNTFANPPSMVGNINLADEQNIVDEVQTLKNGDLIFYKNINTTDIRRWLPAKFLRQVSDATFQISLGGRIVLAHKRQLKLSSDPHRKGTLVFPFESGNASVNDPALVLSPNPEAAPVSSSVTNREPPPLSSAPFLESVLSSPVVRKSNDGCGTSKRGREDEEEDSDISNPDFEFYGYPADSFIFTNDNLEVDSPNQESDPLPVVSIRKSKRRNKKRRRSDFVYY
ncbi:uncharacterized protein LOC134284851 [Aedes albopictus]|uniref:Retrotransposon gag domain-containing protein n=1 Tax=Aedes albopictus TaxID=7160 RepID=A0ABM1YIT3_AEDAL